MCQKQNGNTEQMSVAGNLPATSTEHCTQIPAMR